MNNLRPSELARALQVSNASVSMAVKNGTLEWDDDKTIDLSLPKNQAWLFKMKSKGKTFDLNRIFEKPIKIGRPTVEERKRKEAEIKSNPVDVVVKEDKPLPPPPQPKIIQVQGETSTEIISQKKKTVKVDIDSGSDDLFTIKQKLEIKKLENTNRKEELQIAKIEGALLPTDCVEKIFLWAVTDMKKTYEQDIDNIINIFNKILGGSQKHYIEMRKMAMEKLSDTGNIFKENLLNGLENQVREYKQVRGRGERR